MVVPDWLSSFIQTEAQLKSIEAAVLKAEKKTSAEIVPMVVRRSSDYYQSFVTLQILGLFAFAFLWLSRDWSFFWDRSLQSFIEAAVGFVVLFILFPQVYRWDWVKKWMTHRFEEEDQVWNRARVEFYESDFHKTKDQEGLLIFISLLEKKVVVLTDKSISEQLPPDTWEHVVATVIQGIQQKNLTQGLEQAIEQVSHVLAQKFPKHSSDQDELTNHLQIKE